MAGSVVELTDANFQSEVLDSSGVVLVDFWAEWCGPCRMIGPVVEELADDFKGRAKIGKVNVDKVNVIAAKYNIMSIPTLMIFKDGNPVETLIGVQSKAALEGKLNEQL